MKRLSSILLSLVLFFGGMVPTASANSKYRDGKYIAYVADEHGDIVIELTINRAKIDKVEIISPIKNDNYPNKAAIEFYNKFPQEVVDKQSNEVDLISGATKSYNQYRKATDIALAIASGRYEGNVYYGIAKDYKDHGYVLLEVTIEEDLIKDVEIIPARDEKIEELAGNKGLRYPYYPAKKLYKDFPKTVVKEQSTDIDIVSGATVSTKAYNDALKRALEQAGLN
ncbi:FMN-binding protein [Orenia marismortui]|uniref:FMN-binding protein n=1 Tax=Orenia marismortui TaxID=46469 RepID=UPI00036473B1|nr:FMN-binding protein [Orenia marismortui]